MNSAKSQWKRESGRATCRRSAQTRWRMASVDVGRRGSTIIAFLSNNVAAELNYCQEYHIYLCLSKHFHLAAGLFAFPNCLFCRLRRQEKRKECEDTSRSGRRASRPPAPPAFPSLREKQKALRDSV